MTWSAPEYLHLVLTHNKGLHIPAPTLWLLRFAKFRSLGTGSYAHLLDDFDRSMLPWLREFQVQALSHAPPSHKPGAYTHPSGDFRTTTQLSIPHTK